MLNKIRVFLFGNNHNRKDDQGIKKNKHETDKSYFCLQSWLQISKPGGEQPLCWVKILGNRSRDFQSNAQ